MDENTEGYEAQLVTYIKNILSYQIMPMDSANLRSLVKDAPKHLKLYDYVQNQYPEEKFIDFLKKYPDVFTLNPDRTVTATGTNPFMTAYCNPSTRADENYDEVDGYDKKEYISDSDSFSDSDSDTEERRMNDENLQATRVAIESERTCTDSTRRIIESSSSSSSDSSVDFFSSEIVQTSDSSHSSLSSDSSSTK